MMIDAERKIKLCLIGLLLFLFAVGLCANLSYPLMWGDESETAMFGKRVLSYGYPKIHDGKNIVFYNNWIEPELVIDRNHDAYVTTTWGHYYVAALGILLTKLTSDIYTKTFMMRLPFVLAGLAGIVLLTVLLAAILPGGVQRNYLFLALCLLMVLLSISLTLHLREVRYYSLLIFFCLAYIYLFCSYRFLKT
ncbi:MAG: hypothetical protein QME74_08970, partial [Candidatus Edwardsbacteria bacterium]|nr:hypothetical protein [Candidatus Edwardsbacteria bacterium]